MRVLVLQGASLAQSDQYDLERAILAGPPRAMYPETIGADEWTDLAARAIWLRLAKLSVSGLKLGHTAADRLAELSSAHPQWQVASNERDEFSHWTSGTGDPDFEEHRKIESAPRKWVELAAWLLREAPTDTPFYEDTWRDVCRERFYHSLFALCDLGRRHIWPLSRWREALQAWGDDDLVSRSWHYGAGLVSRMPDTVLLEMVRDVSWWIRSASKAATGQEGILIDLCGRILSLPLDAGSGITENGKPVDDPVFEAINHPVGHVTESLVNVFFKRRPNDGDGLPHDLISLFTLICDRNIERFRHGRVLLSSNTIAFFRVDRLWTETHLLPKFGWANPAEAKAAWAGFLWSPRLYQPLLTAFKSDFLESADHYVDLGKHGEQFAALLTYAALGPTEDYSLNDFRSAIGALPQDGLAEVAQALAQALEGAAEQREEYWRNRVLPIWMYVWPKARQMASSQISEALTRLVVAAGEQFPYALSEIHHWLQPIEHPHYVVHLLYESGLCKKFPGDALLLLSKIIVGQQWPPRELGQCLKQIRDADKNIVTDTRYIELVNYLRRSGGSWTG